MADADTPGVLAAPKAAGRGRWVAPLVILVIFALLWLASIGSILFAPSGERRLAALVADPEVVVADLRTAAADSHVVGRVLYDPKRRVLVLVAKDLSPSVGGRPFVAWSTRRDGSAENLGTFAVVDGAGPDFLLPDAPPRGDIAGVLVTEEADVKVKTPTRDAVRAMAVLLAP